MTRKTLIVIAAAAMAFSAAPSFAQSSYGGGGQSIGNSTSNSDLRRAQRKAEKKARKEAEKRAKAAQLAEQERAKLAAQEASLSLIHI